MECRTGGMQERRNAGNEGCKTGGRKKGGMQEILYCKYIFKRGEMQIVSAMAKIRKDDNFYLRI